MPIASGVYTLIGVAVGTGATGGFQWWLAARKDSREARAARRLVNAELTEVAFAIKAIAENPQWGAAEEMQRRLTARASWDRYAEVLARELSKDEWATLPIAYQSVEATAGLVAIAAQDKKSQQGNVPVIDLARGHLLRALEATKDKEIQLATVEMGLGPVGAGVSVGRDMSISRNRSSSQDQGQASKAHNHSDP